MNLRALHQGPLRAGTGLLAVLYLTLTVSALLCTLDHGTAMAGIPCHPGMSAGAVPGDAMDAGAMPEGGMGDAHHAGGSLCDCLDKLAAHGVAMPPVGNLPAPSTEVAPLPIPTFLSAADPGVLPARGPPAHGFSA